MTDDSQQTNGEIIYSLEDPFEYAFEGGMRTASFVSVKSPTVGNISSIARLKQGFMQAIASSKDKTPVASPDEDEEKSKDGDDEKQADPDNLSGAAIMAMLAMSDVDYGKYLTTAKDVLINADVCLIDGEIKFNKTLFTKLSFKDLEGITGEYLRVFILASVFEIMQT